MRLDRKIRVQLAVFAAVSALFAGYMAINYIDIPDLIFGAGHYRVTMKLPDSAGLYTRGNVTYEGTEVGRVDALTLRPDGVDAVLSLNSGIDIPSDLEAQVHSQSAIGEQYVALVPRDGASRPLRDGDVIGANRTSIPPPISSILDDTNTALQAIPKDNLKTFVDESATAFGGLGPELARIVNNTSTLAIGARANVDSLTTLVDHSRPLLASQADTADSIATWASNVASITQQLRENDPAVAGLLTRGSEAVGQAKQLVDRLKPSLPLLLANLVSVSKIALVYRADLEQILVLLPQSVANVEAVGAPNRRNPPGPYRTGFLSFNLNLNLPPPCTTGYLPAQSRRPPSEIDYPDRPSGDMYCRLPQDSPLNVRGIRNIPCETKPWKRAPTVALCESDDEYVPLNNGDNWKGDPNATLSGQDVPAPRPPEEITLPPPPATVPQSGPPAAPAPPPIATATYDPASGQYVGPDGKTYTQADLAAGDHPPQTWQSMLVPPH
jgi:phospholipid/cholesterol/gamma-HCH transport system substrate-binding protein